MLDELRDMADDDDELSIFDDEDEEDDDFAVGGTAAGGGSSGAMFLGMTPIERMFLSMFLFMNVAILGLALLLATNRI